MSGTNGDGDTDGEAAGEAFGDAEGFGDAVVCVGGGPAHFGHARTPTPRFKSLELSRPNSDAPS